MEKNRIKGITIELNSDSSKLVKKLNAISKHTKALADELDAIEKDKVCSGE